jgi:hypothetical protein
VAGMCMFSGCQEVRLQCFLISYIFILDIFLCLLFSVSVQDVRLLFQTWRRLAVFPQRVPQPCTVRRWILRYVRCILI